MAEVGRGGALRRDPTLKVTGLPQGVTLRRGPGEKDIWLVLGGLVDHVTDQPFQVTASQPGLTDYAFVVVLHVVR